ncbi:MAG TPA: rubredoxin [Coleofasciculaceae cyanobacterium]|jgi:rubredoxin
MNEPAKEEQSVPEETLSKENILAKEKTLAEQAPPSYECRTCGYVYVPSKGDNQSNVPAGTLFTDLPNDWRCPVCGVRKTQFVNVGAQGAPSGFSENLNYGLGVNRLTPAQKNILIFGALGLGFLFFLSLYSLN